jgi:hypothetical protein
LDREIKLLGKKGTPELLYKASRDGFSSKVLLEKTKSQNGTITLVQTNFNTVIGGYTPDQWEDTTAKRCSEGFASSKNIVSGKPFLFYWVNDEIEVIKHKDGRIPYMESS